MHTPSGSRHFGTFCYCSEHAVIAPVAYAQLVILLQQPSVLSTSHQPIHEDEELNAVYFGEVAED